MNLQDKKIDFEKLLEHAQQELSVLRTNRVTPSLIENLRVDVYGSKMPLVQIASITAPETKQLLVEPWDKNILKDVERAIETASLGLSVTNEGQHLRLIMPAMTEETRKEIIKLLNTKVEASRVALRKLRDRLKEEILAEEKNKDISQDERYALVDNLDKMTREYTEKIETLGQKKEKEIML